jgi:ATP-dependent Clp protease adaptor protein ClpS
MNTVYATWASSELQVEEARPQVLLKEPALYQIWMHNDDFTPMEFVVTILESFFGMDRVSATNVMFEVHTSGRAMCGVFSKDVAETKVDQVMEYARRHEHPLLCSVEAV